MEQCLIVITARGGSKRIPRKNIKPFLGKPIIAYSIEAAQQCPFASEVMVSTDDDEIRDIALQAGAKVPFMRSAETANDYATTAEVLLEVLQDYQRLQQRTFEYVCCIYPTAPFVTSEKLNTAFALLSGNAGADSLVPVTRFSFPIQRSFRKEGIWVEMNWPEHLTTRSQDLPPAFHDCGQFYMLRVSRFLAHEKLFMQKTIGLEVPESEVQDIDTAEDWKIAELKYQLLRDKKLV